MGFSLSWKQEANGLAYRLVARIKRDNKIWNKPTSYYILKNHSEVWRVYNDENVIAKFPSAAEAMTYTGSLASQKMWEEEAEWVMNQQQKLNVKQKS